MSVVVVSFCFLSKTESGVGKVCLFSFVKGKVQSAPSAAGHGVRRPRACSVVLLVVIHVLSSRSRSSRRKVVDVEYLVVPLVVVCPRRSGAV